MRAERAVEPTKSENITVTWRRSAVSRGTRLLQRVRGVLPLASASPRSAAMASSSLRRCPRGDAKLLQVLVRQARKNRFVYVILAERSLILSKAKAPQPDHNVHDWRPSFALENSIARAWGERPHTPEPRVYIFFESQGWP